ncbi:dynein axonemal intermediate chain 7 [Bombina bombina]|uniref:dynein axonemal intermediate chain 7 n=1 Tax=Bombina bombina TaxID=8345 RepID=UPI00235AD64E|nr:dynein axonemal intermediate chain 7 [Bombina bombina]
MSAKGASAASKKKGKVSKTEKLRLQKEEEERKLREEEEARLLAEQIEAERLEKERLEREERERLEAKQLEHRAEELEEFRVLLEEKLVAAEMWKSNLRSRAKWDRYMLCDGNPDPTVAQEINTFLSLWEQGDHEDIQSVISKGTLVLDLIHKLEFILGDTPAQELQQEEAAQYQQTILDMQRILQKKFNSATELILKNATNLSDIETGNMQMVVKNADVTLCLWANLNKNPRFKGYEFVEEAIGFELPKPLAVKSVAVRILHTNYDHLSHQSLSFFPRIKEVEETDLSAEITDPENHVEDVKTEDNDQIPTGENIIITDEETKSEGRKSVLSSLSVREETKSVNGSREKPAEEIEKKAESQFGGDTSEGVSSLPLLNDDNLEDEDDVVDLRQFATLGGVYYFDLFDLPPQCKQYRGWTIVEILSGGLQTHPYPEDPLLTNTLGVTQPEKDGEIHAAPPVTVSLHMRNNLIFFEEPQVARWEAKNKNWKFDMISQKKYNNELKELCFSMEGFYTFSLIQDSHLNMPFQSWELKPKGVNKAALSITSAFTEIQLEIKDDQCSLISVSDVDGDLSHILGVWMAPLALKTAMKNAGLNFFPEEDSKNYVSINTKSEQVENLAYKEMALMSSSFAFGWSKWNHNCGYEEIIVKVKEGLSSEDSWTLYMLSAQRSQRMKISEASENFSDDPYDHSNFHSTLYHIVKDFSSPQAMETVTNSQHHFVDCTYQILQMTKVLTYS